MHCGLLEEADMDSTGQSFCLFLFFLVNLLALWRKGASAGRAAADLLDWSELSLQPVGTSARTI